MSFHCLQQPVLGEQLWQHKACDFFISHQTSAFVIIFSFFPAFRVVIVLGRAVGVGFAKQSLD